MRRNLAIGSLFLAWLCAHGAIWDVAQVLAWTRMFAGYAQTLPVGEALQQTFDPGKPCEFCSAITQARDSRPEPSTPQRDAAVDKLILASESSLKTFFIHPPVHWPEVRWSMMDARIEPVPLPPPRV